MDEKLIWLFVLGCLLPSVFLIYRDASNRILDNYITIPVLIVGTGFSLLQGDLEMGFLGAAIGFSLMVILGYIGGGIGFGDVKYATALGMWFGPIGFLQVFSVTAVLASCWGVYLLCQKGVFTHRMSTYIKGLYMTMVFGATDVIPTYPLPEEGVPEYSIPLGTFLGMGAWTIFLLNY